MLSNLKTEKRRLEKPKNQASDKTVKINRLFEPSARDDTVHFEESLLLPFLPGEAEGSSASLTDAISSEIAVVGAESHKSSQSFFFAAR